MPKKMKKNRENIIRIEVNILKKYLESRDLDYNFFLKNFYGEELVNTFSWGNDHYNSINNIWDIINTFETTIDPDFKKVNGMFYTPYFIVDYINRKVIYENIYLNKNMKIIDPACGSGAFLVDALYKLKNKLDITYKEIVEKNLFGIDIDPRSAFRTKVLLSLVVFEKEGVIPKNFNIYVGNSLDKKFLMKIIKFKDFDAVISNPPYVRIQNLDDEIIKIIKKYWKFVNGDTDLFIPFIELGIHLLRPGGKMGYITPNSYFTTHAGKKLREFLQKYRYVEEIIDFDHYQVFENITTYTAITILSKKPNKNILFKRIKDFKQMQTLNKIKHETIPYEELDPKQWVLATKEERELIKTIENSYYKLEDIADIRVGLATLADDVYILENSQEVGDYYLKIYKGKKFLIEKDITKEIIKVSIIKSEKDIIENRRRIIFPYEKVGNKYELIKENKLKEKYPKTYKYLLFCKSRLLKRDRGKKEYDAWYAYGRTQGINTSFGKKILTPPMALKPTFVVCEKEDTTFYSGYGIFPKKEPFKDLYLLKKILNSEMMKIYIDIKSKSYQGGWKSYSKTFIKNFGIPKLTDEEIEYLRKEEEQTKIDEFLRRLYYERTRKNDRKIISSFL